MFESHRRKISREYNWHFKDTHRTGYPKDEIGLKFTQILHFCYLFWLNITKFLKICVPKGSKVFFAVSQGFAIVYRVP